LIDGRACVSPFLGPALALSVHQQETDATLHETMRRATRRLLEAARTTRGVLLPVLKVVGLALLLGASALLVYLGAVLLVRLAVWASLL